MKHMAYKTSSQSCTLSFKNEICAVQTLICIHFSFQYSTQISTFAEKAKAIVCSMDPTNELYYLRVTSRKHEMLVAPDKDFNLIVLQSPMQE